MADGPARLSFLIVGTGRSGTTLVQRLCAELPGVWIPPETHFWNVADRARHRFEFPLRSRARNEVVEWLLVELRDRDINLTPSEMMDELRKRAHRRIGLWQLFESMVSAMSPSATVLGEKTPNHIAWWEQFANAQPHLKYIAVVRDPRAVLNSQRGVAWGEPNAYALAERWLAHERSIRDCARLLGPDRCLAIRYEDLVADPKGHQQQIAELLGVPFEPEPLSAEHLRAYPLFATRESWKSNAMGAVTQDRIESWRDNLAAEDVAVIDAMCGPEMKTWSYLPSSTGPPPRPDAEARERVRAYRVWYAEIAAFAGLPIY